MACSREGAAAPPEPPAGTPPQVASAAPTPGCLETASQMPLMGLIGILCLAAAASFTCDPEEIGMTPFPESAPGAVCGARHSFNGGLLANGRQCKALFETIHIPTLRF